MLKVNNRTMLIVMVLFSLVLISGCRKENLAITMNQDVFLNQNASMEDNQAFAFNEVPSKKDYVALTITPAATTDNENDRENASGIPLEIFEAVNETV